MTAYLGTTSSHRKPEPMVPVRRPSLHHNSGLHGSDYGPWYRLSLLRIVSKKVGPIVDLGGYDVLFRHHCKYRDQHPRHGHCLIQSLQFQWYFWGYSLAFSSTATNGFIGDLHHFGLMNTLAKPSPGSPLVPELLYSFYQVSYVVSSICATGAASL